MDKCPDCGAELTRECTHFPTYTCGRIGDNRTPACYERQISQLQAELKEANDAYEELDAEHSDQGLLIERFGKEMESQLNINKQLQDENDMLRRDCVAEELKVKELEERVREMEGEG